MDAQDNPYDPLGRYTRCCPPAGLPMPPSRKRTAISLAKVARKERKKRLVETSRFFFVSFVHRKGR